MKRYFTIMLILMFCFLVISKANGLQYRAWAFAIRSHVVDIVPAKAGGELLQDIFDREKPKGAVFARNCMYFERTKCVPVGFVQSFTCPQISYPCDYRRAYICQDKEGFHITDRKPEKFFCTAKVGLLLLSHGKVIPFPPEGDERNHYKQKRLRTICATRWGRIVLLQTYGSLPQIAKYLKDNGYESAANFDGGSSSTGESGIPNACVVYQKYKYKPFNDYLKTEKLIEKLTGQNKKCQKYNLLPQKNYYFESQESPLWLKY